MTSMYARMKRHHNIKPLPMVGWHLLLLQLICNYINLN